MLQRLSASLVKYKGGLLSTFLDRLGLVRLTPEMFGAKGDGVTDDTDALKSYILAVLQSGVRDINFGGKTYKLVPKEKDYVDNKCRFLDIDTKHGITVSDGTFLVDLDMSLGEWKFIYGVDSNYLKMRGINVIVTATSRYTKDTALQPVNCIFHVHAHNDHVRVPSIEGCTLTMTHVSGEGQQGYNTAYGKLLPVYFQGQIFSNRGDIKYINDPKITNLVFDKCIEYAIMSEGANRLVAESCSWLDYGGRTCLPPFRWFAYGGNGLKINNCDFHANPDKPASYTQVQIIYGVDNVNTTSMGRKPPRGIQVTNTDFYTGASQHTIFMANFHDIKIDNCNVYQNSDYAEDGSSGMSTFMVQHTLSGTNSDLNNTASLSITNTYVKRKRRCVNLSNVAGTITEKVNIRGIHAEDVYHFAVLSCQYATVTQCYAKGTSQGDGLGCQVPSGVEGWHVYSDNTLDSFANAIAIASGKKDQCYHYANKLSNITNSLSSDALHSAIRTIPADAISTTSARFMTEIVKTDNNKVWIALNDKKGWIDIR